MRAPVPIAVDPSRCGVDPRVLPGGWVLPEHREQVLRDQRSEWSAEPPAARPSEAARRPRAGVRTLPALGSYSTRTGMAGIAASVLVLVTAAGPTFGDEVTTVQLTVDGAQRTVTTSGEKVQDVLLSAGLTAGPRDLVAPALDATIRDGSRITVRHARLVTLQVDGNSRQWWTTARTVDDALLEMGVRAGDYQLSASRSREIPPGGTTIVGEPMRWLTLVDGTRPAKRSRLAAPTVRDALRAAHVQLGRYDRVAPALSEAVRDGDRITITRIEKTQRVEKRTLPQPAPVVEEDPSLGRGNTVQASTGSTGQRTVTMLRTVVNGSPREKVLSDVLTRRATPAVQKVGTKETGLPESWSVPWDQMAFCESTSRWDVNTGNGTYGGLQFMTSTWLQYGGGEFASRADLATKEQQIIVAERLYAQEGLAPWHCARLLGWGFDKYEG